MRNSNGGNRMDNILQTSHLAKTIKGRDLVTDVNIHVRKGEIYGF